MGRPRTRRRPGTDEHALRHPMGHLPVEFLLHTGCRKMEAQIAQVDDIRGEWMRIPEHKTDDEDDGVPREVNLSQHARRVLADAAALRARMRHDGPLVFPGERGTEITNVNGPLETACAVGGIRRLVPHSLRSVHIDFCARQGVPLEVCSKNVGHRDIRTTRRHHEVVRRDILANANTAMAKELDRLLARATERPAPRLVA